MTSSIPRGLGYAASVSLLALMLVAPGISNASAVTPTLSVSETTANATLGTNDQTDVTTATLANVVGVKAARTLTVGTAPTNTNTFTIENCAIAFATTTAGVTSGSLSADDTNCLGGATILTTTGTSADIARTPTQIATALLALTNATSTTHGTLAVTASSTSATSVVVTTAGTETAASSLVFTDGTSGKITTAAASTVTGIIPVAQISTVTIGGTVEPGDIFTVTLPTVGAVTYTVPSTATTAANIATGLNAAILASSGYAAQAFTSAASTNTVVLTAKVAGTGFVQTSGTTNRVAATQVDVYTPGSVSGGFEFNIIINGTSHKYNDGTTAKEVVEGLVAALAGNGAATCTENDVTVTCTALAAGTGFVTGASVANASTGHSSSGSGSGGGGSSHTSTSASSSNTTTTSSSPSISSLQAQLAMLLAQVKAMGGASATATTGSFMRSLTVGSTGADVMALQAYLNAHGYTVAVSGAGSIGHETTTFGGATKAALIKMQTAAGISPAVGYFGALTRAYVATH